MLDVVCSLALWGLLAVMMAAYLVRALLVGRRHERRLAAPGTPGAMLGRSLPEAGYWMFTPVVNGLVAIGATPNLVTTASLLAAIGAGVAYAFGHFGVAAVLATSAGVGDLLDGQVARKLGITSEGGEVFDAAADRYGEFATLAGLLIFYREQEGAVMLVLLALHGSFMVSYATAKAESLNLPPPRGLMRRAERAFYITAGAATVPLLALLSAPQQRGQLALCDLGLFVPLALVALLANGSAISRFRQIAAMAHARQQAKQNSPLPEAPVALSPAPLES